MVECLLNYSGLTFTVSLWKAEQALVKSYKPLKEKAHNLQLTICSQYKQPLGCFLRVEEKGPRLWHIVLLKIYCQSGIGCILLKKKSFVKCRPVWDESRRKFKTLFSARLDQWCSGCCIYASQSSNSSILLLAALEAQYLTEDKERQRGKNNDGRQEHVEEHCRFLALWKGNDWQIDGNIMVC